MIKSENQFLDLYRSGIEAVFAMTKCSIEGAERLRNQQMRTLNEALADAGETGRQIGSVKSFDQFVEMQSKLAPAQLEKAMGYWTGWYATSARNQVELMQNVQSKVSDITEACQATFDAAPRGAEPAVAPLKSAVSALCSAYAMTARATEEAARFAVTQIENAGANGRQAVQSAGQAGAQAATQAGHAVGQAMGQAAGQGTNQTGNPSPQQTSGASGDSRRKSA
jgi:phasin family protein